MAQHLTMMQDRASLAEISELFRLLPSALSTFSYLGERIEWYDMIPLTRPTLTRPGLFGDMVKVISNTEEQWITEVETWFMNGILDTIIYIQNGVQVPLTDNYAQFFGPGVRENSFCTRILFRDGNHTNINWLGFWATTASLIFICLSSWMVGWIHMAARTLSEDLADSFDLIVKGLRNQTARFWRSTFSTRRTCPDSLTLPSELSDMEPVSAC
jgi:hypothetical protein